MASWPNFWSQCKSRLSAIARSCFLSREHWCEKCQELKQVVEEIGCEAATLAARNEQLEQAHARLQARVAELELDQVRRESQPPLVKLPLGLPPPGQQFGVGMITLCVNLAREIGLRRTVRALRVVLEWLGIACELPQYQTIRTWMQRVGLDQMQNAKKVCDGTWLVDHTNQIGPEKVLTIMRVRASQLPPRGTPLSHKDMELLAVIPAKEWKREDVAKVYQELTERCGVPRCILTDGAVELREPAKSLGKRGDRPLVFRDAKHFLANQFESILGDLPEYQEFTKQIGRTRSAVQQTELAHFVPPSLKQKARFMNLQPTLNWASMVLWHLDHPMSKSRKEISEDRMEEKLGWLRDFAPSIKQWQECQQVVSVGLTFINNHGIFHGAAAKLKRLVKDLAHCTSSKKLVRAAVRFILIDERQLKPQERLPMSTEILESSFAMYKQLEQQHAKSGFSSLLLGFGSLLRQVTCQGILDSFARVKVADVTNWTKTYLADTYASKRQTAFRESRTKTKKRATTMCATG